MCPQGLAWGWSIMQVALVCVTLLTCSKLCSMDWGSFILEQLTLCSCKNYW